VLKTKIAEDGILGPITRQNFIALQKLIKPFLFVAFDGFLAIRCSEEFDNKASDFLLYVQNQEIKEVLPCTTRAGNYWVYNPITYGGITGTAVMCDGFYPKVWEGALTKRFGIYSLPELVQVRPVKVYRDGNKDKKIDRTNIQIGMFGINLHQQGWAFAVDNWSAGCFTVPYWHWQNFCNKYFEIGKIYDLNLININEIKI
jgi:hypothetical protein